MKNMARIFAVALMAFALLTGCSKLTKENYDQVKVGMTKEQVIDLLGKPGDKHDAIGKIHGNQLKVSVTAAPRSGKATDHMVRFLAKEFGVAIKDIEVVFGQFNVNKQLRIKAPSKLPTVINKQLTENAAH